MHNLNWYLFLKTGSGLFNTTRAGSILISLLLKTIRSRRQPAKYFIDIQMIFDKYINHTNIGGYYVQTYHFCFISH